MKSEILQKTRPKISLRNLPAISYNSLDQIKKFTANPLCRNLGLNEFTTTLTLQSLLFFDFLACFVFRFPCFLVRFPFFSKDFRGSAKRKTLFSFSGFPLASFKKARETPTVREEYPHFRELTRKSAFVWFGLPERLLTKLL